MRQLLKHKQTITITEMMPPAKWTFPPPAKTPLRKLWSCSTTLCSPEFRAKFIGPDDESKLAGEAVS
ncbi:MAG: hypothetical protein H0W76_12405 [Pyrinomonadaceae bacterium]|nr:hypothetical protein [Pyrinomonadaceae bacterium]